jgi:gluconate 2-dehydrogenase gamma chain
MNRRNFIAAFCLGAAVQARAWSVYRRNPGRAARGAAGAVGYRFFDATEARFVEAACECLIPADGRGAGAGAAGVPHYLDRQLAGAWGSGQRLYRSGAWLPGTASPPPGRSPAAFFRAALAAANLDIRSRGLPYGREFDTLPVALQESYLRDLAAARTRLAGAPSSIFFQMLLGMTVEGFLSNPDHGHRLDRIGWAMAGFPGALGTRS